MATVHLWGASGYAAAEAIRLIDAHPLLELGVLESRSHAHAAVADHFPLLRKTRHRFSPSGAVLDAVSPGDVVIAAGAHGEAAPFVERALDAGARVVDLSADFRFSEEAVYGLTEWRRDAIARAALVANPGCYPTATLLGLLPLAQMARAPVQYIVDAKSGITGAGRNPSVGALFAEVSGDVRAYGLDGHRHEPEIVRYLNATGIGAPLVFTPHVVPIARGMLVDAYAIFDHDVEADEIVRAYATAYAQSPFVRVIDEGAPSVAAVVGTNDAEIRIDVRGTIVRVICALDNLGKGAAGQALQNINVMLGYPQEAGFDARAVIG